VASTNYIDITSDNLSVYCKLNGRCKVPSTDYINITSDHLSVVSFIKLTIDRKVIRCNIYIISASHFVSSINLTIHRQVIRCNIYIVSDKVASTDYIDIVHIGSPVGLL
jgi:hypothetical protein